MWVACQLTLGLACLVGGGELLVRGAVAIAATLRISPLVIGLTVVAFGTSAPELGVSLQAAMSGNADVAVGNVVGSNIINVLFILGAASIITPLVVSSQLVRLDVPVMIVSSITVWFMASDGSISRGEGLLLFGSLIAYITYCIRKSRSENRNAKPEFAEDFPHRPELEKGLSTQQSLLLNVAFVVGGLVLLGLGSKWLVGGATTIATALGVSQLVIGLTIVAIGTSLPEVVTSIVASYRGERDIAVGNVVGSNMFNLLCVLGLTATVSPAGVNVASSAIQFDIPVMVAVAVICLPVFMDGNIIRRWEGALFLLYYATYNAFVVFTAKNPLSPPRASLLLTWVVVPLTVVPVIVSIVTRRKKRRSKKTS
ncbi:Inner membrane protein YrbG [Novipirellula artificiosorum]|uniref:Inner membrane protein YrbG n=2 Tax=Novipirellula artificiosorum TaxID=2528016 RepID=A0A5C6DWR9_9BACT|nr:Inner membrane protein YrbG [Novipirellula artificiosorum]